MSDDTYAEDSGLVNDRGEFEDLCPEPEEGGELGDVASWLNDDAGTAEVDQGEAEVDAGAGNSVGDSAGPLPETVDDGDAGVKQGSPIFRGRRKRIFESGDEEFYDPEVGNSAAGLKILMSLMLISFIVIISVLVYKMNNLKEENEEMAAQLEAAPNIQELDAAKADILAKEQEIKRLADEISQYKAANAVSGELVETPDGWVYVVAMNDTLGRIAQEYGISVGQIIDWNDLENPDVLKIGQRLIVRKNEEEVEIEY